MTDESKTGAEVVSSKTPDLEHASNSQLPEDAKVVYWEGGEQDLARPLNWSGRKKWANLSMVSLFTFLTPLASSMVAPGVASIMNEFQYSNQTVSAFVVSIYILGYSVGPLLLAPLSEMHGRLPVYHTSNIMYCVWTMACALSPNVASLLVFRFLAGVAGSCSLTLSAGSITDLIVTEKRGGAIAVFALGPMLGPCVGPVMGGYLSESPGWRWVFWVLTIASGICTVLAMVVQNETYEPVLLQRHVDKLRKQRPNEQLQSRLKSLLPEKDYMRLSLVRPLRMLMFSPIVCVFSVYMGIVYGYLYLLFTSLPGVFQDYFGFGTGEVGLTYLGIGIGLLLGVVVFGAVSDRTVKRHAKRSNGVMKPESRLSLLVPASILTPAGLLWYGWSAERHLHWIMPIMGTALVGAGLVASFMPIQTYLVDSFPQYSASVLAAATLLRSLAGAFLPLAGPGMYEALGYGWGSTLLALVALAMTPISWAMYKHGEKVRTHPRFQVQF